MLIPSLRKRALQISMGAFVATSSIAFTSFLFFSVQKQTLAQKEIEIELQKSAPSQVEQLLPSFLLPEQKLGSSLLLEKFRADDELEDIRLVQKLDDLPSSFSECIESFKAGKSCVGKNAREIGIVTPVSEGGKNFGYLFKSRHSGGSWAMRDLLQVLVLFISMLAITFLAIYIMVTQFLSKKLPGAIDNLVHWIEGDLLDKKVEMQELPFLELEILKSKISEILERHNRERDQAMIGQLSSGVLHDMKTLVHSISLAIDLSNESKDENQLNQRNSKLLKICAVQIPKMNSIIESVLDGSREVRVKLREASLLSTLGESSRSTNELAEKHSVRVVLPKEDIVFLHDPSQLERAFTNLIKNGIEAFEGFKTEKREIVILAGESPEKVFVSIQDTGPGLSIDRKRLFSSIRTTKSHGTGLGLVITRKLLEAHNGRIQSVDCSNGGAKFEIEFEKRSSP